MSVIESISLPATAVNRNGPVTKYDREYAAFRRMLPALLQTHLGQYVAVHNEQAIVFGVDRLRVVDDALSQVGDVDIHVGHVSTDPEPRMRSGIRRDLTTLSRTP